MASYTAEQWRRLAAWCKANEKQIAKAGFVETLKAARLPHQPSGWSRLRMTAKPDADNLRQALDMAGVFYTS